MIVIVETNFLVEVAHIRTEVAACDLLIERCRKGELTLAVPACSFTEAWHVWQSDTKVLREHQNKLGELRRAIRSRAPYQGLSDQLTNIPTELINIVESEKEKVLQIQQRLLDIAHIIPLDIRILRHLLELQAVALLEPHDGAVLASVVQYCKESSGNSKKVFVTKDAKDFSKPDIETLLNSVSCAISYSFEAASRLDEETDNSI